MMEPNLTASLKLVFDADTDKAREHTAVIPIGRRGTENGESRLFHEVVADITVATERRAPFVYNARARRWLEFPGARYDFSLDVFSNVQNTQELWRELCNVVLSAEHDLLDSMSYKNLEPLEQPSFQDDESVERLYFLHKQKMSYFNRCVYGLVKVQDLVNRLLHEAFSGTLVRADHPDWERKYLTREHVLTGLDTKSAQGQIAETERQLIVAALVLPDQIPERETVLRYRNRLTHHVSPSVD